MASSTPPEPATGEQQDSISHETERLVSMLAQLMMAVRALNTAPAPPPRRAPTFPRYLLPSLRIPFRRYRLSDPVASCSSSPSSPSSEPPSLSTSPSSPSTPKSPTPPPHRLSSNPYPQTLRCARCSADFAYHAQIVSKAFFGRHGRAYLVSPLPLPGQPAPPSWWPASVQPTSSPDHSSSAQQQQQQQQEPDLLNIRVGTPEDRQLATGLHTVADISCAVCGATVGWKYLAARSPSQRYKVGKFILETGRVVAYQAWEDEEVTRERELAEGLGEEGKRNRRVSYAASRRRSSAESRGVDECDDADLENERPGSRAGLDGDGYDADDGVVVFDSEDEEECEDIFAGVWDPSVVAQRRRSKAESTRGHLW